MIFRRSYLKIILSLILLVWIALFAFSYFNWSESKAINKNLAHLQTRSFLEPDSVDTTLPGVQFAYAYYLHQRGMFDEAVDAYGRAERFSETNHDLTLVYYNMGNLYLEEAAKLAEQTGIDRATALADVAKDLYRSALKQQSDFWPAKYNLEAAQRLSRDLPLGDLQESGDEDPDSSAELWSAMPGFPLGLP